MSNIEHSNVEPLSNGFVDYEKTTRKQQRVKKKAQINKEQQYEQQQDTSKNLLNDDAQNSQVSTSSSPSPIPVGTESPQNLKISKPNKNVRNKQNTSKRNPVVAEKKQIPKNDSNFKPAPQLQLPSGFTNSKSTIVFKKKGYKTTRSVIQKPSGSDRFQVYDSRPKFSSSLGINREIQNVAKAIREGQTFEIDGEADAEQIQEIQQVEKAIRDGHVFEIRGAVNLAVRHELLRREWVEKPIKHKMAAKYPPMSNTGQKMGSNDRLKADSADSTHWPVAKRLLNRHPANLIWADVTYRVFWQHAHDFQIVNKHPGDTFALKKNLMDPIQSIHWFGNEIGVGNNKIQVFPRSYRLYVDEEKEAFLNDYKFTACLSLLKWFIHTVEKYENQISKPIKISKNDEQTKEGSTSPTTEKNVTNPIETKQLLALVEFALSQVKNYINVRKHEDIDMTSDQNVKIPTSKNGGKKDVLKVTDWNQFLNQCNQLTQQKVNVQLLTKEGVIEKIVRSKYNEAKESLKAVRPFWPQFTVDGMRNVWIFKPGNGIQGIGISILDKFETISQKFLNVDTKRTVWIAQKYLEKPMTILKTKFDIRQWFLVSSWQPLTIWFYKKCYLRFSSKIFSLEDLHESIHLTNNSVQSRYKNDPERDPYLPNDNMWSNTQFQNHLKKIGQPNLWSTYIYPTMKSTILALILSVQDKITDRPNSFQLMGADFMVSEDFHLYFLEINACPVLSNSTSVTSKLCPEVIQDVLKVALDWKGEVNPKADTGDFELLYQSKDAHPPSSTFKMDGSKEILIRGKKLPVLIIPKETKFSIDQVDPTNVDEQI